MSPRRLLKDFIWAVRRIRPQLQGVEFGPRCRLGPAVRLRRTCRSLERGRIVLGADCDLRDGVILETWGGEIVLGQNVFLGPQVIAYGHGGIVIGDQCLISMHCRILSSNHTVPPFGTDIRSQPDVLLPTRLGRDVWLGAGVTVLGGVTIGDGCVIGAGAVVTKDLPPGAIAHGVPATVKGWRKGAAPSP